jgi:hypothetical protein
MKKLLLFFALFGFVLTVNAQSDGGEGTIKIDIGAGYAKPTDGFGVKPGFMLAIEPHYYFTDNFAVGIRFEGALLGYQAQYNDELFSFFGSSAITGDYYFTKGKCKPFIGTGFGLFTRHYIFENDDYTYDDQVYTSGYGVIKLGFLGRAGLEVGHIKLTATYNVIGSNFSYAGFTVGYILGK